MSLLGRYLKTAKILVRDYGPSTFFKESMRFVSKRVRRYLLPQGFVKGKVLFISGCPGSSMRYRCYHHQEQLDMVGISSMVREIDTFPLLKSLAYFDVFVLHRVPFTKELERFIREGKKVGKKFIFDTDDLVFHKDFVQSAGFLRNLSQEEREIMIEVFSSYGETAKECDLAIASTHCIQEALRGFVKKVVIHENAVNKDMIALSEHAESHKQNKTDVTIGYFSGSNTHHADIQMIVPVLKEILTEHHNVQLLFVGEFAPISALSEVASRVQYKKPVDWSELPALIKSVDINIAPLQDTLFNRAKSDIKFLEAALLQVPTVASNIGAFTEHIEDKQTGMLASTAEEWKEALDSLVLGPAKRKALGKHAYEYVMSQRTSSVVAQKLKEIALAV